MAMVHLLSYAAQCQPRTRQKFRTSVYPSNFAPIAAKFRQRAFRTICKFRFFDAEIFFSENFLGNNSVFRHFRQIFEELGLFWRQNQVPRGILLRMVKFSGLYDAWSSFFDFSPFSVGFWRARRFLASKSDSLRYFIFGWSNFQVCTTLGAYF